MSWLDLQARNSTDAVLELEEPAKIARAWTDAREKAERVRTEYKLITADG